MLYIAKKETNRTGILKEEKLRSRKIKTEDRWTLSESWEEFCSVIGSWGNGFGFWANG